MVVRSAGGGQTRRSGAGGDHSPAPAGSRGKTWALPHLQKYSRDWREKS